MTNKMQISLFSSFCIVCSCLSITGAPAQAVPSLPSSHVGDQNLIEFSSETGRNAPLLADASSSSSAAASGSPTHSTPMLRSGTEDSEQMNRSVKLLIPAPPAPKVAPPPPPVRQFQAGAQQGYTPNSYSAGIARPAPTRLAPFRLQTQNNSPAAAVQQLQPGFFSFGGPIMMPTAPAFPRGGHPPYGYPGGIWRPGGYPGVSHVVQLPPRRQTFGAQIDPWTNITSVEPFRAEQLANLQTAIKRLHSGESIEAKIATEGKLKIAVPVASQLKAAQMALPLPPAPKSWDEWYRIVAASLYDRWRQNTAGPGSAIVLINVSNNRDVDCRVTEFTPAVGADRNVDEESRFKQVALQCVSTLSGDEFWQFPATTPIPKQIVFDMEFKHAVGEDSGCKVIHLHNGQSPDSLDEKK